MLWMKSGLFKLQQVTALAPFRIFVFPFLLIVQAETSLQMTFDLGLTVEFHGLLAVGTVDVKAATLWR